jgi:hypothetical protein
LVYSFVLNLHLTNRKEIIMLLDNLSRQRQTTCYKPRPRAPKSAGTNSSFKSVHSRPKEKRVINDNIDAGETDDGEHDKDSVGFEAEVEAGGGEIVERPLVQLGCLNECLSTRDENGRKQYLFGNQFLVIFI